MNIRSLAAVLLLAAAAAPLAAGVVWVPAPRIAVSSAGIQSAENLAAPGYSSTTSPGEPALPSKDIRIILPPDADPESMSVSLVGGTSMLLGGKREIGPSPPMAVSTDELPSLQVSIPEGMRRGDVFDWGGRKQIERGRNVAVYRRNSFYPAAHVELVNVGNMRKWRIATVRYYPYRYNPVSKRLRLASGGKIALSFSARNGTTDATGASSDDVLSDEVHTLTANYAQAQEWYGGPRRTPGSGSPQATTGYAIITTSAIVQGSVKLQAFVNHKANRRFGVSVVTESQWGGGTGDAAANNIRAWLKANYVSKAIKYVLLIGDPNPATGAVPMKMLWPRYDTTTYREAPSDYFYADLTGNWDRNGNGYYGDPGDFGAGGIDLFPEVIVGRIPFYGSFSDLDSILQKTIDYESGGIGGSWIRNVLVTMKPSDANTPGYQLGEAIKNDAANPAGFSPTGAGFEIPPQWGNDAANPAGFGATRVYDQTYGLNPPPDYIPCTYDNALAAINQHAGFWFWWTHGNETLADQVFSTDRTANLDDHYPSFTFQCSCLNGTPERSDNLGYALLKRGAIATDSATRVSWYYPGQVDYTNTDSNAGMTYRYAVKLVRDHLACGDAHYTMMLEVPQNIWMNHLVFNIYGDPSVAYTTAPLVSHTPLQDTDDTVHAYRVTADVASDGPLAAGNPVVDWSVNGGATFDKAEMSPVSLQVSTALSLQVSIPGGMFAGWIPPQPLGATVYYYVSAQDSQGRIGTSPTSAPTSVYSFKIRLDTQPPVISHIPLTDTGLTAGPYPLQATATDDCGVGSVVLHYSVNSGAEVEIQMLPSGGSVYEAAIPGPMQQGDRISYYILATDTSLARKTARSPVAGYHAFSIKTSRVAVYNSAAVPPYFVGSNSNIYASVVDALSTDPKQRFSIIAVTSLTPADLSDKDSLVLPDNGVAVADLGSVRNWFAAGKTIVAIDSSACYAAYSGLLWPNATGTDGFALYWDQNAAVDDQKIVLQDPITAGYALGQIIKSRGYGAQFYTDRLPADAKVLAVSNNVPNRAYAVYRDVPGAGRFVALGPYRPLETAQYSILREALAVPSAAPRSIQVTYPAGGESFDTGQSIQVRFSTSGSWSPSDKVEIEYTTGVDPSWYVVPGASSLPYNAGVCSWDTSGLPASLSCRLRATLVGGSVTGECAGPFAIAPVVSVAAAKAIEDGRIVKLAGVVVMCASPSATYVEETSRTAGIRVNCSQALTLGDAVTLTGTLATVNGERVLSAQLVEVLLGTASNLKPIAMTTATLGGGRSGYQQAVTEYRTLRTKQGTIRQAMPAGGASNVGILVTITGKVTAAGPDYFYLDDGSACDDGSGLTGVRVICPSYWGGISNPAPVVPAIGACVVVTGVSSTYFDRGSIWRAVVLPGAGYARTLLP